MSRRRSLRDQLRDLWPPDPETCAACVEVRVARGALLAAAELEHKGALTVVAVIEAAKHYATLKAAERKRGGPCCRGRT